MAMPNIKQRVPAGPARVNAGTTATRGKSSVTPVNRPAAPSRTPQKIPTIPRGAGTRRTV